MKVRFFEQRDYKDVSGWWSKHNWPTIPLEMLSPNGFIAEDEDNKYAATWIFKTDCPMYIMEWTIGNPNTDHEKRTEAIYKVTDTACEWARENGASQVFTMTKHPRLIEKLEKLDFIKSDDGMTHLIRSL